MNQQLLLISDLQAPASIKKSIQGIKLQWQLTPNLPAAPLNANYQVNLQTTYSNPTANIAIGVVVDYEPKEGICKEGKKFNVYVTDRGNGTNALYLLGSFDKEEEANRFHAKVLYINSYLVVLRPNCFQCRYCNLKEFLENLI